MMKRSLQNFGLALALLGFLALNSACNKPASPGEGDTGKAAPTGPILVGEFASLHGTEATFGDSSHKGTKLAIDEMNASGGVLGRKLKLITEDNNSKAGESATIVRKLISRDNVVAVLGEV